MKILYILLFLAVVFAIATLIVYFVNSCNKTLIYVFVGLAVGCAFATMVMAQFQNESITPQRVVDKLLKSINNSDYDDGYRALYGD
jgi:ABC-type transport system involved in multi-copper enzyme maturation permease subunit